MDPSLLGWQVRLDDKFAQHGMICVVIVRKENSDWDIDSWLQSCRVLERGVEHCVMNTLFNEALVAGVNNHPCPVYTIRAKRDGVGILPSAGL